MKEDPDSLRSTQTVEIVDLWCEGEIQGLVNGLKSVYLDGVPIENADGSRNFEDVRFEHTKGTQGQGALAGFDSVQLEVGVGVVVTHATPVVRTITDAEVDTVRVTISLGQLTHQKSNGDLKGSQFEYVIEVQSAGGGFVERVRDTVKGKRTNGYKRAKKIALTGAAPWDIRVRRISVDAPTLATQNAFAWESYTEVKSLRLRYPNSAVSGLRFSAQASNRVPGRAFDIMAMRVQVPTNYDPLTRVYTGTWDGTFKVAWTDSPAWIFRETATHPRWGLGRFVSAQMLNKWVLYRIAQYCDGLVSDGNGGVEPRFTCNLYLQTREQAIKVLQDLAAVFRGICYWAGGELQTVQDAPQDPVMLFTPANVEGGLFNYQSSSEVGRHSVFIVYYNDFAQLGKRVPEVYAPPELVARYGIRELELSPIGVSSRGQAARLARWAAYTEEMEGETVSFRVGAEGALAMPGQVFQIADPSESGERLGGRIHAASEIAVEIDAPVELASGEAYTLSVQVADPSDGAAYITEERAVTNAAGPATVLAVSPPFTSAPAAQGTWLLQSTEVAATTWRCLALAEVDGAEDKFEVLAVAHHPGKFDLIEADVQLQLRPISRVTLVPPVPGGPLSLIETPYLVGTIHRSRVSVGWVEPAAGLHYQVSWRQDDGPWQDLPMTSSNEAEVEGLPQGLLEVRVRSQNALGNGSGALSGSLLVEGKTAAPSDVADLAADVVQGGVRLRWTVAPDFDYLSTTLTLTHDGSTLFEGAADSFLWAWPPLGTYTVTAVHWDTSLNASAAPASVTFTVDESIHQQWANVRGRPKMFKVLARGYSDTEAPGPAGLYDAETGAGISGIATGRSYHLAVIDRITGSVIFSRRYDVYGVGAHGGYSAADLASDLNATDSSVIVVVWSGDEPQRYRLTSGLDAAMYRCGASRGVFGSPEFRSRSAYVLVGIGGCGEGNGAEFYNGQVDNDSNAWCGAAFYLQAGELVVSGTAKPRSLRDQGYVGSLDATADLSLVATGNCVLQGNSGRKAGGTATWGDAQVYSRDGYAGGACATAVATDTTSRVMFGLDQDPTADASFSLIDHALYMDAGTVEVYESGTLVFTGSGYSVGDVFAVVFDGFAVRYLRNGVVVYTSLAHPAAGTVFFFDSAFYDVGARLDRIRFAAMSTVAGLVTEQLAPDAFSQRLRTPVTSAVLYTGAAAGWFTDVYVDGNTLTTVAGSTVVGSMSGGVVLTLNTTAPRWGDLIVKLQLVRVSDGAVVDESGQLPINGYFAPYSVLGTSVVQLPVSVMLPFDAQPAGTYKVRAKLSASVWTGAAYGVNLTDARFNGEICAIEFKR